MNWLFVIAQPYEPQRLESSRMASQSSEAPISANCFIKEARFEQMDYRNSSRTPNQELSCKLSWSAKLKRPSRFLVNCSVMARTESWICARPLRCVAHAAQMASEVLGGSFTMAPEPAAVSASFIRLTLSKHRPAVH